MGAGDGGGGGSGRERTSRVPTSEILSLTKAVSRIEIGVKTIKDDLLPPVVKDAREAKDACIALNGGIGRAAEEVKTQGERLDTHGLSITEHEQKIAGLGKTKAWTAGIIIPVILAASAFAGKSIWDAALLRSQVTTNTTAITERPPPVSQDTKVFTDAVESLAVRFDAVEDDLEEEEEVIDIEQMFSDPGLSRAEKRQLKRMWLKVTVH